MKKMTSPTSLPRKLAEFLLIYRSTPHAATGLQPDKLFLRRRLKTHFSLTSPNLTPRIEKQQEKQKSAQDGKRPLVTFSKGEKVLVCNKRGNTKWVLGIIIRQKSPVTYLVKVGDRIRFCHTDHVLRQPKTNILTQSSAENDFDVIDMWPETMETPLSKESVDIRSSEIAGHNATLSPSPSSGEVLRREIRALQRLIEELLGII